jgi:hypothetical protein
MKLKTLVCALMIGSALGTASVGLAQQAPAQKAIRIANDTPAPVVEKLDLAVTAAKPRFAVNEKIALKITVSKDAYLYITTRNTAGESVLLSPLPDGKLVQVKAGTQTIETKLIGDAEADEQIVVVASTADLGINGLSPKNFDDKLAAKGLRITNEPPRAKPPVGVTLSDPVKVAIKIANDDPIALEGVASVTIDKHHVDLGDTLRLTYGTTKPGWVNLYVVYPNGVIEELLKEKFDAPATKTVSATVVEPMGRQTVVAVWSINGDLTVEALKNAGFGKTGDNNAAKGLKLREMNPAAKPAITTADVDVGAK